MVGVISVVAVLAVAFFVLALFLGRSEPTAQPSANPEPTAPVNPPASPIEPDPPNDPEPPAEPDPEPPAPQPEPDPEPPAEPDPEPPSSDLTPRHDGSPYTSGRPADAGDYRVNLQDAQYAQGVLENNALNWQAAQNVTCAARPVEVTAADIYEQYFGLMQCAEQVFGDQLTAYFGPAPLPDLYFYSGEVTTPCGTFSQYVGYFCATWDGTTEESAIYINSGDLQAGDPIWGTQILLHEYGHAIQWRTQNLNAQRLWPEDSTTTMLRSESQVECLSGVLMGRISSTHMTTSGYQWYQEFFVPGGEVPGYGTGAERWYWIWGGYHNGEAAFCNTWALDQM